MKPFLPVLAVVMGLALSACGGGGGGGSGDSSDSGAGGQSSTPTYKATGGVAQKGPLIQGSTVTAQELDASLSPTGKQYSYQITSNFGSFSPTTAFTSQYIGLNATGYYFDEVAGQLSTGTVTLNGYNDLSVDTVLNVNLLSTLAYQRIQNLITKSGMSFTAARSQAENEVLAALYIPPDSYGTFGTLDISGGSDGDHVLVAISSLFTYGHSAGPLSQLIASFQSDIGTNGVITNPATTAALVAAAKGLNPATIAANLTTYYASAGLSFTAGDITPWIAAAGDGVIGKFAFQVPDATPTTVFTFPTFAVRQFAGMSVSVTAGQLSVNGTPASGTVVFNAGDTVTLTPGVGNFPSGVLTCYLVSNSKNLAKVAFVSDLVSIAVTPNAASLPVGLTQQFKATGTFSDTSTADLTNSVQWTSSSQAAATIGATSGLTNGIAVGTTTITATSGSVSGSTTLAVTLAKVQSISILPNPAYAGVGIPTQLTATGTYSDGTRANVTASATWTSSAPSIATVGPTTGQAVGVALGTASITASIGSVTATTSLNVTSGQWSATGSLISQRWGHTATLLQNGKVLVVGGWGLVAIGAATLTSAELYDPVAGTWSPTGSLTTSRYLHTATLLPNGKVLVVGGVSTTLTTAGYSTLTSSEIYDPASGTWSTTGSLTGERYSHTATLLPNGKVLAAAGYDLTPGGSADNPIGTSELYDPVAGTWSPTGNLLQARSNHTATLLQNGTVLVVGGEEINSTNSSSYVYVFSEVYDPAAGTWSQVGGSVTDGRYNHTATLLPNGQVLIAGGYSYGLGGALTSSKIFDPVANTWSSTGSLSVPRYSHTATLLPNGKILVAGGAEPVVESINVYYNDSVSTAELYDPVAGTWSMTGGLLTGCDTFTATLLQDGAVLAAGGENGSPAVGGSLILSPSAELYW